MQGYLLYANRRGGYIHPGQNKNCGFPQLCIIPVKVLFSWCRKRTDNVVNHCVGKDCYNKTNNGVQNGVLGARHRRTVALRGSVANTADNEHHD